MVEPLSTEQQQKQIQQNLTKNNQQPQLQQQIQQNQQIEEEEDNYEAQTVYQAVKHTGDNNGKHLNEYQVLETIGNGSFTKIKKVLRSYLDEEGNLQKSLYAMKVFHKNTLKNKRFTVFDNPTDPKMTNMLEQVQKEIEVQKFLNNKHLIKLYQIIDDPDDEQQYIIMQYADLGQIMDFSGAKQAYQHNPKVMEFIKTKYFKPELIDKINKNKQQKNNQQTSEIYYEYEELELIAKIIFKQVAEGLEYLNIQKQIVHRDIKLDNILCMSSDDSNPIKIADFTTAKKFKDPMEIFYDVAGTPGFRGPELIFQTTEGYNPLPCDVWSLGICLYAFFNLRLPFYCDLDEEYSELSIDLKSKNDEPVFKKEIFQNEALVELLQNMLKKEPLERIMIEEVVQHPWFQYQL